MSEGWDSPWDSPYRKGAGILCEILAILAVARDCRCRKGFSLSEGWILVLSNSRPLGFSSSCSVAAFSFSQILEFSSSRPLVISSSRHLVLSSSRTPVPRVVLSHSRILATFSRILVLSHCRPPYLLHIQVSPAVQQVFPIHCCFNSRSLLVGYCCLLVVTVTTASVSLAGFCQIIIDGGNTALHSFR
jgi:hypothetical protein